MENPPKTDGGHRRAMSEDCDVIIHDVDDGVVLVVENRDKIMYTMRFDFGASENLKMNAADDVEKASDMKCNIELQPGTVRNLCFLEIADKETMDHFEMKYRVQCLVRNSKGELEQVKPPAPPAPKEDKKKITDTLHAVFQQLPDGYVVFFESSEASAKYNCKLDIGGSDNLELMTGPDSTAESDTVCSFSVNAGQRLAVAKLSIEDASKGGCRLSYRVMHNLEDDAAAKKAAEEAAKKKADDEAAAAKKKADEEAAAKKKADDEAAAKKAADEAAAAKAAAEREKKLEDIRMKLALLQQEEQTRREKIIIEERGRFVLIQREYRESMCNLCRGLLKQGQEVMSYKIYKLHKTCYDRAPKCDWCGDILIGEYVVTKGDLGSGIKLHKECIEPYKKKARPVCSKCNQQIMDDKWSSVNGKPLHEACK